MQNANGLRMLLYTIYFKTRFFFIAHGIKNKWITFAEFTMSRFTYKFHKYFNEFSLVDNSYS